MTKPSAADLSNLPKDIRLIINEHSLESALRPLVHREYKVFFFEDYRAPICLLQASKTIKEELYACLYNFRRRGPLVITCSARSTRQAHALNRMLAMGRRNDTQIASRQIFEQLGWLDTLGMSTETAPMLHFRSPIHHISSSTSRRSAVQLLPAVDFDQAPLDDFLYFSLKKM